MSYCKRHDFDDEFGCQLCFEEKRELPRAEQRELEAYFRAELRRVRRTYADHTTAAIVLKPRAMKVAVAAPAAHAAMSMPACLCMGDTAASLERRASIRVSSHDFWIKTKPVRPEFSRQLRKAAERRAEVAATYNQ